MGHGRKSAIVTGIFRSGVAIVAAVTALSAGVPALAPETSPNTGTEPVLQTQTADTSDQRMIADGVAGRKPSLRIVSLAPSQTEIVFALGLGSKLVGWTQYEDCPIEVRDRDGWVPYDEYQFVSMEDELAKDVAVVGSFTSFNTDLIEALDPTLILAAEELQESVVEELRSKGYNVMWSNPKTLDDAYDWMLEVGRATGRWGRANRLVRAQQREIDGIRRQTAQLEDVSVYVEISHYGPWASGSGSPLEDLIEIAGGVNIFSDVEASAFPTTNAEIVGRNPDVILTPLWAGAGPGEVTTTFEIMTRENFGAISAVQNDRVYHYDSSLFKRPGPRQVDAIKKLAYLLHPYEMENPEDAASPWELGRIDSKTPPPPANGC